jgi:mono/diheme cytochrome c family protein
MQLRKSVLACAWLVAAAQTASAHPPIIRGNLGAVGEGRRMFLQFNCSGCHGNAAAGGMGPNIMGAEGGDVSAAINGDALEGGMRSFKGWATAKDASNIAAYLQSIGTSKEPKWLDWWKLKP